MKLYGWQAFGLELELPPVVWPEIRDNKNPCESAAHQRVTSIGKSALCGVPPSLSTFNKPERNEV